MIVRELLTKFGFEIEGNKLNALEKQIAGISHKLNFLVGAEAIRGLVALTERFGHLGAEIHSAAAAAGLTAEAYQGLTHAGKLNHVSTQEMSGGLKNLSKQLYASRMGSVEAAIAFTRAGININQALGFKNSQEALLALSDRFKLMKDPIEKAAIAQQLLGKGGANMIGFLNLGSKAIREQADELRRLGLLLTGPQLDALKRVSESLTRMNSLFDAVWGTIAAQIAPVFERVIDIMIKFYDTNRNLIGLEIKNWLLGFSSALGFTVGALELFWELLTAVERKLGAEGWLIAATATFLGLASAVATLAAALGLVKGALALSGLTTLLPALIPVLPAILAAGGAAAIGYGAYGMYKEGAFSGVGLSPSPSQDNSSSFSVNTPIQIFMKGGESPQEVGNHLTTVLQGFWDQKMREARIGTQSPIKR